MKTIKIKSVLLFVTITLLFTSCSSSAESKIVSNAKEVIDQDLSDDISIIKCLYNEETSAVYVKFSSNKHGRDEAIILLDDDSVFYESVYSQIKEDDYNKIIQYGDYTIMKYQIVNGNSNWIEMNIPK